MFLDEWGVIIGLNLQISGLEYQFTVEIMIIHDQMKIIKAQKS